MSKPTAKAPAVVINGDEMRVIEYHGQRVVTLAQVDAVHQRPRGTARRNLSANRSRLIAGEDYAEITADEIRAQSLRAFFPARTAKGVLLTESGYLMLAKSFTDDLAWKVQRTLVASYFRKPAPAPPASPAPSTPSSSTASPRATRCRTRCCCGPASRPPPTPRPAPGGVAP